MSDASEKFPRTSFWLCACQSLLFLHFPHISGARCCTFESRWQWVSPVGGMHIPGSMGTAMGTAHNTCLCVKVTWTADINFSAPELNLPPNLLPLSPQNASNTKENARGGDIRVERDSTLNQLQQKYLIFVNLKNNIWFCKHIARASKGAHVRETWSFLR